MSTIENLLLSQAVFVWITAVSLSGSSASDNLFPAGMTTQMVSAPCTFGSSAGFFHYVTSLVPTTPLHDQFLSWFMEHSSLMLERGQGWDLSPGPPDIRNFLPCECRNENGVSEYEPWAEALTEWRKELKERRQNGWWETLPTTNRQWNRLLPVKTNFYFVTHEKYI